MALRPPTPIDRRRPVPARTERRIRAIHVYLLIVCTAGLGLFAYLAPIAYFAMTRGPYRFWLFAAFILLGELFPIRLSRRNEEESVSTSTTFSFALFLAVGLPQAVLALALASFLADLILRKPWWKIAFNVGQYTLALGAASLIPKLFQHPIAISTHIQPGELGLILLAGAAFFIVNNVLVGVALALAQGQPLFTYVREGVGFQASTTGVLLALSPLVVIAADSAYILVPFVVIPMAAIYRSAKVSVRREHEALHDPLTKLPNRSFFQDRLSAAVQEAKDAGSSVAVLLIDLDRFKDINDTLGHQMGDQLLNQVGPRLHSTLRDGDTIARLGGDEFAVLLPNLVSSADPQSVASKIITSLEEPFLVHGFSLDIDASMGVAIFPENGSDADTLMRRADIAMYLAKQNHTGYELYDETRDRHSPEALSMLGELRRAIEDDQLVLYFQPKVDIRTNEVHGVEGLLRWHHPERGLVQPMSFIPVAEHTGLIGPLTHHVLNAALRQCALWRESDIHLNVSVNISVRNLYDPNFAQDVQDLLKTWEIDPSWLELEITEGVLMADPKRALQVLTELSALGLRLTLDDFGTGYSSLAYLKRLPVDCMKIDKSFVINMAEDENDSVIVQSTVELGRSLGLQVVAEGVENATALKLLAKMGCHVAQGFLFSKALPAGEFRDWLAKFQAPPTTEALTIIA